MAEQGRRSEAREAREAHEEAERQASAPPGKPAPESTAAHLQEVWQRLQAETERYARLYSDAQELHALLGEQSITQVLDEVSQLEARRAALAQEIGTLEARLIELQATVQQAETAAKG